MTVVGVFCLSGVAAFVLYSQYFSQAARIKAFSVVKADINTITGELTNSTLAKDWSMKGLGGSADNPAPCGHILNGFNNQFDCAYTAGSMLYVNSVQFTSA
jgi:hypothetical protein